MCFNIIIVVANAVIYSCRYRKLLGIYHITQSASAPATPVDNAVIEAFFSCLKRVCLYAEELVEVLATKRRIREYVLYYNHYRILQRYGVTPYERWCAR